MTAADANMAEIEKMFAVDVLGPMRMVLDEMVCILSSTKYSLEP